MALWTFREEMSTIDFNCFYEAVVLIKVLKLMTNFATGFTYEPYIIVLLKI